jgi:26S proteasome regulatory subunit N11
MDKLSKPSEMFGGANLPLPCFNKPLPDVGETICISSLFLLKMQKHGSAGVPLEVMELMFTSVVDVCLLRCFDYLMYLCR